MQSRKCPEEAEQIPLLQQNAARWMGGRHQDVFTFQSKEVVSTERRTQQGATIKLQTAAAIEDTMQYMEPPRMYQPTRQCLGYVLLEQKRFAEAQEVCFSTNYYLAAHSKVMMQCLGFVLESFAEAQEVWCDQFYRVRVMRSGMLQVQRHLHVLLLPGDWSRI